MTTLRSVERGGDRGRQVCCYVAACGMLMEIRSQYRDNEKSSH